MSEHVVTYSAGEDRREPRRSEPSLRFGRFGVSEKLPHVERRAIQSARRSSRRGKDVISNLFDVMSTASET
jgi:hypothetical protein